MATSSTQTASTSSLSSSFSSLTLGGSISSVVSSSSSSSSVGVAGSSSSSSSSSSSRRLSVDKVIEQLSGILRETQRGKDVLNAMMPLIAFFKPKMTRETENSFLETLRNIIQVSKDQNQLEERLYNTAHRLIATTLSQPLPPPPPVSKILAVTVLTTEVDNKLRRSHLPTINALTTSFLPTWDTPALAVTCRALYAVTPVPLQYGQATFALRSFHFPPPHMTAPTTLELPSTVQPDSVRRLNFNDSFDRMYINGGLLENISRTFSRITSLDLSFCYTFPTEEYLKLLTTIAERLPNLEELSLQGWPSSTGDSSKKESLTPLDLSPIASLKKIVSLNLGHCTISTTLMEQIKTNHPDLNRLSLFRCSGVTSAVVERIGLMTGLRDLDVSSLNPKFTNELIDFAPLQPLTGLTRLVIMENYLDPSNVGLFDHFTNLRFLGLGSIHTLFPEASNENSVIGRIGKLRELAELAAVPSRDGHSSFNSFLATRSPDFRLHLLASDSTALNNFLKLPNRHYIRNLTLWRVVTNERWSPFQVIDADILKKLESCNIEYRPFQAVTGYSVADWKLTGTEVWINRSKEEREEREKFAKETHEMFGSSSSSSWFPSS